ncbi:MAG: polyprenyl diphosphate synthase [Dehalococcoidia bacterium]|nr:polyprenyl diphosphate synthase [Dehalococcoidia bacterium]
MVVNPANPAPASPPLPALAVKPQHVAIIMDGNGRWAQSQGLSRSDGHRAGADAIRPVIRRFAEHQVPVVTLFGFSTENWGRPKAEIETILKLGAEFIDSHLDELNQNGVRVAHLGGTDRLPIWLRRRVKKAVEATSHNDGILVNLAFNYGGRDEILDAVKRMLADGLKPGDVTPEALEARLTTAGLPDVDLLVRTGGEQRVSNFLVWQSTYAEYYFTPKFWPEFDPEEVDAALLEFAHRHRRFGLVAPDEGD